MTITTQSGSAPPRSQLEVRSPGTGELLGTLPIHGAEDVQAAVARARRAFGVWGSLTHKERRGHLLSFRRELVRRMDEIIDVVHRENGKPRADAAAELMLVVSHLTHAANRAAAVLKTKTVGSGVLTHYRSRIDYYPYGVIGVIGPWNFPIHTPMGSISYALAAGNTVVFKPSELTPLCGKILVECAEAAIPIPHVLQLVTGYGETGSHLVRAGVDKVAFTGSPATGRRVMAAAVDKLTPLVLELGGKDPLIVAADADLDQAAKSAVYGALWNAGQACTSIERVYVVDSVYDAFLAKLLEEARGLKVGDDDHAHYGAMTLERQIDIVRDHVQDALAQGARAVLGGMSSFRGRFIEPIVLTDVTPDMKIMREETFGPVLPVVRVQSTDEAVRLANDSVYGLGSAVFSKNEGDRIAQLLNTGMTSVNAVLAVAGIPTLPFGGRGESGFGRIHGDEGILVFARSQAVTRELFPAPGFALVFGDPEKRLSLMRKAVQALYAGSVLDDVGLALRKLSGRD